MRRFLLIIKVAMLIAVVSLIIPNAAAQQKNLPANHGKIVRLDPRFDKLVPKDAVLEKLADGFTWVEGPAWHRREQYLLFSDIPTNSVFKWQEGKGVSLFLKPSGYTGAMPFAEREPGSNGLTFDPQGRLVLCERGDRRISRLNADGTKTTLVDRYQGKRLNSPNDVIFKSNGDTYFTDPPFGLPKAFDDPNKELDFQGVYRLATDGKLTLLTKEIKAPNGLAFSPTCSQHPIMIRSPITMISRTVIDYVVASLASFTGCRARQSLSKDGRLSYRFMKFMPLPRSPVEAMYMRTLNPRKSNPSLMFVISVFSSESFNPLNFAP